MKKAVLFVVLLTLPVAGVVAYLVWRGWEAHPEAESLTLFGNVEGMTGGIRLWEDEG